MGGGGATIAVWGHYHGGNLGDELVVDAIVDAIRRHRPDARIVGISMAPADTQRRHGIDACPINPPRGLRLARLLRNGRLVTLARRLQAPLHEAPFLWKSYRMLRSVDLVVVAGSGQLLDEWRGPWLHPYTTFRWSVLSRLARVPIAYASVGAGPIDSGLSAFFIRSAVRAGAFVSVRDAHSGRVLESIGARGPFRVVPDMGYGLPDEALPPGNPSRRGNGTIVGLNVMAHQDPRYWPRGDRRRYDAFLRKMVSFTEWLLDEGFAVRLFSSQPRSDKRVAGDLIGLLSRDHQRSPALESVLGEIDDVGDLVKVISGCDVIVAGRFHSVLLPLLMGIPVLGLAYHPKTSELLADVGRPGQCLDIDSFEVDSLIAEFRRLAAQVGSPDEELRTRVEQNRAAVEAQFREILAEPQARRSG